VIEPDTKPSHATVPLSLPARHSGKNQPQSVQRIRRRFSVISYWRHSTVRYRPAFPALSMRRGFRIQTEASLTVRYYPALVSSKNPHQVQYLYRGPRSGQAQTSLECAQRIRHIWKLLTWKEKTREITSSHLIHIVCNKDNSDWSQDLPFLLLNISTVF